MLESNKPTPEQTAKIKGHMLDIMDEIHRICIRHGIKYSLIYGSMMGAVLYEGFIPWDDDIDIVFLRDDFERFSAACMAELKPPFFFQSSETDPEFLEPELYKIRKDGTALLESADMHRNIHHGVWVDITIMENCDGDLAKVRRCKKYFSLWRDKYYFRSSLPHLNLKGTVYHSVRRLLPPFTIKRTAARFSKLCRYCDDTNSPFLFHPFSYQDDIYPRSWMQKVSLVPFEGRMYYMFDEYDKILRVRFPNYTPDYPEEKRKTTHRFVKIEV